MIIDNLFIPSSLRYGIKSKKGGHIRMKVFGADIETVKGEPKLLTITSELKYESVSKIRCTKKDVIQKFLSYLHSQCLKGRVNLCFFHYLKHDLVALLYQDYTVLRSTHFMQKYGEHCEVEVFAGSVWFATIRFKDIDTIVYILDSYSFVFTSLAKIAEQLKFKFQKKGKPKNLGKKIDAEILDYAVYDTLAELELANWIVSQFQNYKVKHAVSLAHLASEVFKTHFIPQDKMILQSPSIATNYAVRSYHGGRNGMYIDKLPAMVKGVTEVDIVSCYPKAMQDSPNFLQGEYINVSEFDRKNFGIYKISGDYRNVVYPILFDDDFSPVQSGFSKFVYCTSLELSQAKRNGQLQRIHSIQGIVFKESERNIINPLKNYAEHFFKLKSETPKSDSRYLIYKLLMNALYGKFFQRTEEVTYALDENGKYIRKSWIKAGGLFQPFIASYITAHARVALNKLEIEFTSLHSSTDSIKTQKRIPVKRFGSALGDITREIFGDCLFFRNKLYIHFNNEKEETKAIIKLIKSKGEKFHELNEKEKFVKYALHGFQGNIKQLIQMYESRKYTYTATKMLKVREAIRSGQNALQMIEQERKLNI